VGCAYKQQGVAVAVDIGLRCVGARLPELIGQLRELSGPLRIYCWRGGMRSGSLTALCQQIGLPAVAMKGGYKAFRRWALQQLCQQRRLHVLGGYTGCGKSELLRQMASDHQVLDLEQLANHRGSSFGAIGLPPQPTTEQFENQIACQLAPMDPEQPVWVEDESRSLGHCKVPDPLFAQMTTAPLFRIERSIDERVNILVKEYGAYPVEGILEAVQRLSKRLGGLRTAQICNALQQGELAQAAALLLDYYDRTYTHAIKKRIGPITDIDVYSLSYGKRFSF